MEENFIPQSSSEPMFSQNTTTSVSKKIFLMGLGVVFLIILSFVVTYLILKSQTPSQTPVISPSLLIEATPTPDLTANWKTFQNKYIIFKYPSTWKLEPSNDYLTTFRSTNKKAGGDYTPGAGWINFSLTNEPIEKLIKSIPGVDKKDSTVINGYQVTRLSGYSGIAGSVYFVTVFLQKNGNMASFSLSTQDTDLEKLLTSEFDQILFTFKFLE